MRSRNCVQSIRSIFAAVVWLAVASLPCATAQPPTAATAEVTPPAASRTGERAETESVEELDLPLFLEDKDGKLVPVPGFTLEEFHALWKLKNQREGPSVRPPVSLTQFRASGAAKADYAELTIQLMVRGEGEIEPATGVEPSARWGRVPLRLNEAILTAPAEFDGPGEHELAYDEAGGFECWVRGPAGAEHRVVLHVLVPIAAAGDERRLKLTVPAVTPSEIKLTVPLANPIGTLTGGLKIERAGVEGGTEFTATGLRGEVLLAWRDQAAREGAPTAALESTGAILVRLDGSGATTDARLIVRSFNEAAFDRFVVRLPPGAVHVPSASQGYAVAQLAPTDGTLGGRLEISRTERSASAFEVRVACAQAFAGESKTPIELGGFEVEGAFRQAGHLALEIADDWQADWEAGPNVRQVSGLPESLTRDVPTIGFEYTGQPFSLLAAAHRRPTRIHVVPEYVVEAQTDRIALDATLDYTFRGGEAFAIELDTNGWTLDRERIAPAEHLDLARITEEPGGRLRIPLISHGTRELALAIHGEREAPPDAPTIEFSLPQPVADTVAPALVSIVAAENVELAPRADEIAGLSRQPSTGPQGDSPKRLNYRADRGDARFVADRRVREGEVSVELTTRIDVGATALVVEQSLEYRVSYEPLDEIVVAVPRPLADIAQIEYLLDGEPIAAERTNEGDDAGETVPIAIALPVDKRIGRFELSIKFVIGLTELAIVDSKTHLLPLCTPAADVATRHSAGVTSSGPFAVEVPPGEWRPESSANTTDAGARRYRAEGPASSIGLVVNERQESGSWETVVERAVIQTWLTGTARHERAIYRILSKADALEIVLPQGAAADDVQAWLDEDRALPAKLGRSGRVTVQVPLATASGMAPSSFEANVRRVEVRYRFAGDRPPAGRMTLAAPSFSPECSVRDTFWQVLLPPDEHLLIEPTEVSAEYAWNWTAQGPMRRSAIDRSTLDAWIGTSRPVQSTAGVNDYVFSSLEGMGSLSLATVRRSVLVLVASTAALAFGLLLMYVSALRRPASLFAISVVSFGAAMIDPSMSTLVLQASALGGLLVLIAAWLRRGIRPTSRFEGPSRRVHGSSIVRHAASSRNRRAEPVASTDSAPVAVESAAEAQP